MIGKEAAVADNDSENHFLVMLHRLITPSDAPSGAARREAKTINPPKKPAGPSPTRRWRATRTAPLPDWSADGSADLHPLRGSASHSPPARSRCKTKWKIMPPASVTKWWSPHLLAENKREHRSL